MALAKFVKGYRLDGTLFIPGEKVDLSKADFDRLVERGIVVDPVATPAPVATETTTATEPTPEPDEVELDRPAKAAGVDKWRSYAEAKGYDVKGLDKAEIIALCS